MKPDKKNTINAWEQWTRVFHAFFFVVLIGATASVFFLDTTRDRTKDPLALTLAAVFGIWYLSTVINQNAQRGRTVLRLGYLSGAILLWAALAQLHQNFLLLGLPLVLQSFGFVPLKPWGAISALAIFGLWTGFAYFWANTTPFRDPQVLVSVGLGAVSSLVLAGFIDQIISQSRQRQQLIDELQRAQMNLADAERQVGVLQERERIARDIHDNLGHALVAMSVQLEAAQRLYKVDTERASKHMDEMKLLTRDSMDVLRRTLAGLRAPSLGNRNLRQAIQESSLAFNQRSGVSVDCHIDDTAESLARPIADALWCVSQEALTNIDKHAKARHVQIDLNLLPNEVKLSVADDGIGIAWSREKMIDGHYGLQGIRERVEGLGGKVDIVSTRNNGTRVEATIPT
jgi:signal transduction histidine kinase